jgi:hypothetical protein
MTDIDKLKATINAMVDLALLKQGTADYHDRPEDAPDTDDVTNAIMAPIRAALADAYARGRDDEKTAWHKSLADRTIS